MPGGTWLGLETARRGMKVHQHALDITGHNLANASTPGYSRQEAVINATSPYTSPDLNSSCTPGQFGTGVEVSMIRRVKDEYLDNNVRRATTDSSYWEDQISVLQQAEATFAEPISNGIGARLTDFFKGWMSLNNTPQSQGNKAVVAQIGDELATLMTGTYNQLDDIDEGVAQISGTSVTSGKLKDQVDRINNIFVQIGDLTESIKRIYSLNQQPNDLLDKRDQLLEELSRYGPVSLVQATNNGKPTGEFSSFSFFGTDISADINANSVNQVTLTVNGSNQIILQYDATNLSNLTTECKTNKAGSLLGLESARQDIIDYKARLNNLAATLQTDVNTTLGTVTTPFIFFDGSLSGGDFRVPAALLADSSTIDGTKAGNVADLRQIKRPSIANSTYEEYYNILLTNVGNGAKGANDLATNQQAIKQQITALRDSISGVSTDEELTKMVQFQYGFQASARMVSVQDELLDVIINRLQRG